MAVDVIMTDSNTPSRNIVNRSVETKSKRLDVEQMLLHLLNVQRLEHTSGNLLLRHAAKRLYLPHRRTARNTLAFVLQGRHT